MFIRDEKRETTVTLWQLDRRYGLLHPWGGLGGHTGKKVHWVGMENSFSACLCSLALPWLPEPNQVEHPAPAARHSGIVLIPGPPLLPLPTRGVLTKEALRDGPERTEAQGLVTPSVPLASSPPSLVIFLPGPREGKQAGPWKPEGCFCLHKGTFPANCSLKGQRSPQAAWDPDRVWEVGEKGNCGPLWVR